MTEEPVDFSAELNFNSGNAKEGKLVFKNENPSDKRQLDKTFEISVKFENKEVRKLAVFNETKIEKEETGFVNVIKNFFINIFDFLIF
jgi:hypothetical protein